MARFRLMGEVELLAGARRFGPGPPQRRALLAALLVDLGTPLAVEALVRRLWDGAEPSAARNGLYVNLTGLRRLFAEAMPDGATRIERIPSGYLLTICPQQVDLHQGRQFATRAADAPDEPARVRLLRSALRCWEGDPLPGVEGAWAQRVREGLRGRRLATLLSWAGATARTGRTEAVLPPLERAAADHPRSEALAALRMQALALVGRRAEALECFARVRNHLAATGGRPGQALVRLNSALLGTVDVGWPTGPEGLPGAGGEPVPARVVVVTGEPGVDAGSVALRWAREVAEDHPDGVHVADLGVGAEAEATDRALAGVLNALGVPAAELPEDPAERSARFRTLVARRRMVLVLLGARSAEQVRPLLPGTADSLVLVTSEEPLAGLVVRDGARRVVASSEATAVGCRWPCPWRSPCPLVSPPPCPTLPVSIPPDLALPPPG